MNQLSTETSPYLRQHAENPVQWHPWNSAALERARTENKPLLISIGYAACHWCHVMAHECFEDPAIAALMNKRFINIKIDREERPDLDAIYQSALAFLGQHGGWPLTMFCTPTGEPFWGGTYFPPEPRYGRPGFPQVLTQIADIFHDEHHKITRNTNTLMDALRRNAQPKSGGTIHPGTLDTAAETLARLVDRNHGGLRGAPKFPQPSIFAFLWRAYKRTGKLRYRQLVETTLTRMAQGGIYDHLGGGFARYSVDAIWLVPHFEKMLYDNAQLIELYTLVWQETRSSLYRQRIAETVDWLAREMTAPGGAFYATLDADTEGDEGKYYIWTAAEIDAALGPDSDAFKVTYGVRADGNWEGKNILNRITRPDLDPEPVEANFATARATLLQRRAGRTSPGLDDKIIADWNGLAITALAYAASAFNRPTWLATARTAFLFIQANMQTAARLSHTWQAGQKRHPGTLDDHANMARAALLMHEVTAAPGYLTTAKEWVATLDHHFWDHDQGGYYFTADDTTDVITRTKTASDNATPAGNATMIEVLARLSYITGDGTYVDRAHQIAGLYAAEVETNTIAHATFLSNIEFLHDATQIILIGKRDHPDAKNLLTVVYGSSVPNRILATYDSGQDLPLNHPATGKSTVNDRPTVYLCRGPTCSPPITNTVTLRKELARLPSSLDADNAAT